MNQLILNVVKGGLLAIALKAPAAAQTFEVTFAGTFTSKSGTVNCHVGSVGCTPSSFDEQISVPFTHTMTVTLGLQSGFLPGGTSVTPSGDDLIYRRTQFTAGGRITTDAGDAVDVLPKEVLQPHPVPQSAEEHSEIWSGAVSRSVTERKEGGGLRSARQAWSLSNAQGWYNRPTDPSGYGTGWGNNVSISVISPFPVTPENFDDTFTPDAFLTLVQSSVGCIECIDLTGQSYLFGEDFSLSYFASGRGTLLSFRTLATPVPEPQRWALMLCGVAALGWAARGRQRG